MGYKPVAPLMVAKPITKVKGIPEITQDNPIVVGFRQADGNDNDRRQQFNFVPYERRWMQGEVYAVENFSTPSKPLGERRAYDIYLTMTECDILNPAKTEDVPLFKFSNMNGAMRVVGGFEEFKKSFLALPMPVQLAIYDACLEANPLWLGPQDEEDSDEEAKNE